MYVKIPLIWTLRLKLIVKRTFFFILFPYLFVFYLYWWILCRKYSFPLIWTLSSCTQLAANQQQHTEQAVVSKSIQTRAVATTRNKHLRKQAKPQRMSKSQSQQQTSTRTSNSIKSRQEFMIIVFYFYFITPRNQSYVCKNGFAILYPSQSQNQSLYTLWY